MDQFYLKNATRYQSLVKALKPTPVAAPTKAATEVSSPDMVVSARIRPFLEDEAAAGYPCALFPQSSQQGIVDLHDLYNHPRGRPILKSSSYQVDRVFGANTTTEEIYEELVEGLIPFARDGGIGTLFAYGQTGSGKTFTVSRLQQLVIESLMDKKLEGKRQAYVTIIELAGNSAYDLLSSRKPISLLEDSFGVTQMAGANEHLVDSRDQIMKLVKRAASFRRTAPTMKNDASSRSHSICRIRIADNSSGTEGFLYLIDLAGSEAARDIAVHGADRMRETREINIGLSVLKDCIRGKVQWDALVSSNGPKSKQKKPYIPFRQSALTKVLKHVFDPADNRACKTVVIACVNPSLGDVGSSRNTLRYAEMLRVLVPATSKPGFEPLAPTTWTNTQLRDWIANNSGTPPISPDIVAPTESGARFLHLPASEVESRCLNSPGVSIEQAKAFYLRLWQLHIVAQKSGMAVSDMGGLTEPVYASRSSSRIADTASRALPFKQRIRPGMAIGWSKPSDRHDAGEETNAMNLAVVLSSHTTSISPTTGGLRTEMNVADENAYSKPTYAGHAAQYLCAVVSQGLTAGAYEVNLWQQIIIDVENMDKEVILEYDTSTRYYYISV